MRIAVSPDYRENHRDDLREVEARADDLDVFVSTFHSRHDDPETWTVRVRRGSKVVKLSGQGDLPDVIAGALDDFEELYGEPWTAEEILIIAEQSGMDVTRA